MTDRAPDTDPVEVELKYRVTDKAAAERLISANRVGVFTAGARARTVQQEDRYVDTTDGSLSRAGFAVRLRKTGSETRVSIKSLGRSNGPSGAVHRVEIEGPADRVAPAADWPPSDARSLVLEHAGDGPLVELVTIRQLRRQRQLRATGARIELSLDEVDVVAQGRLIDHFVELEAELVRGDETALEALAERLSKEPGLRLAETSKLEAALRAVGERAADDDGDGLDAGAELAHEPVSASADAVPDLDDTDGNGGSGSAAEPGVAATGEATTDVEATPETASVGEGPSAADIAAATKLIVGKSPGVTADDHIAEAGRKVMRFHLARMLDYEAGTRAGTDPEDLHKMRVATRRQRAAWRIFGEAFRAKRTRRYRNGLRETASRLGAVRDLDVQLEAADAYRHDLPASEQRALEPLLASWRAHRDDARILLLRELDSDHYRRWVDDYRDFVRTEGALVLPVGPVQPHRVRDTAPSRIWAAYEGVRGYEAVLRWADVETLHDLRIAAKWLRYALEFVREALGDESGPLIARVTALQDHLGLMHDADVTAAMARTFLVEHAGDLSGLESAAIGRYLVDREREVARLRRTIGPTWRGVAGLRFRRSLGRVVAGL
ncbi:MAG: CHAD domain-containing protein [Chloroflexota bacterium]|nr:CHAD domain-containing protein [Chloroflexota bacterium]MDH5243962.1 CHAD domain-containing protein [Chloroflexota bacterium]